MFEMMSESERTFYGVMAFIVMIFIVLSSIAMLTTLGKANPESERREIRLMALIPCSACVGFGSVMFFTCRLFEFLNIH